MADGRPVPAHAATRPRRACEPPGTDHRLREAHRSDDHARERVEGSTPAASARRSTR
nr:hypothetical protein [Angustibacter aerolatus]